MILLHICTTSQFIPVLYGITNNRFFFPKRKCFARVDHLYCSTTLDTKQNHRIRFHEKKKRKKNVNS